jgi:ABC-type lipoprotein export system ATPase subunit
VTPVIDVTDVTRTFGSGPNATAALRGVNMSEQQRVHLRRETVTYTFQSFSLLPGLSAAENVGVPLRIAGMAPKAREERVATMLTLVGLAGHARHRPGELSGGQQQRVAIARALAPRPRLLLADEPTGQLDAETGKQIMRLIRSVVRSEGVTALLATHDPTLMDIADSILHLTDGAIVREARASRLVAAAPAHAVCSADSFFTTSSASLTCRPMFVGELKTCRTVPARSIT